MVEGLGRGAGRVLVARFDEDAAIVGGCALFVHCTGEKGWIREGVGG